VQAVITLGKTMIASRRVMLSLAVRGFQSRYIGTGGGMIWSIVHPLATVFIFWIVFSLGFKSEGPKGIPFLLYFMTAFLPWHFVNEVLSSSANTVVANRHLATKMVFPTETLPIVEIMIATAGHLILLAFTILLLFLHGEIPGLEGLQIIYAYLCAVALSLGLSWFLAAMNVFHRDVSQSLATLLNFWFWMTPIVWSVDMVPERWQPFLMLNPMLHVIESYRGALLYASPLWSDMPQVLTFWAIVCFVGVGGAYVFLRLKPEFADVL
jgi:lipopolysaccharide transport system permease protein/teichoic acid transport system permease protein